MLTCHHGPVPPPYGFTARGSAYPGISTARSLCRRSGSASLPRPSLFERGPDRLIATVLVGSKGDGASRKTVPLAQTKPIQRKLKATSSRESTGGRPQPVLLLGLRPSRNTIRGVGFLLRGARSRDLHNPATTRSPVPGRTPAAPIIRPRSGLLHIPRNDPRSPVPERSPAAPCPAAARSEPVGRRNGAVAARISVLPGRMPKCRKRPWMAVAALVTSWPHLAKKLPNQRPQSTPIRSCSTGLFSTKSKKQKMSVLRRHRHLAGQNCRRFSSETKQRGNG